MLVRNCHCLPHVAKSFFFFWKYGQLLWGEDNGPDGSQSSASSHLLRQMPALSGLVFDIKCTLKEKVIQWPTMPLLLPPIAPENSSLFVAGVREACQHV